MSRAAPGVRAPRETIVITGANRGIGLALAAELARAGKRVIGACRAPARARELAALEGEVDVRELDVVDEPSVVRFAASLADDAVDVLVCNAGVGGGSHQALTDMDYRAWRETFEVNTIAPFRLATALLPNLRRSPRPRIVALSSQMASLQRKSGGAYAYRSSKAALNKVMQVLSVDLEREGIVVCPVHPGWVRTDMGGAGAELSADASAQGLHALIESLGPEHSGRFWTWDGKEHPW
ncbi:MAG TPA: SDR family oxidoreductase [Myxococcota bacterium]|nr:SDR family oxidoreductase [Myxococcota bacterium]